MKIDDQTIMAAFNQHNQRYASAEGSAWGIKDHVKCWQVAHQAFDRDLPAKFKELYNHLRGEWQVFRGAKTHWSAQETFDGLKALPRAWRGKRLSALTHADAKRCQELLEGVADIKRLKDGVSVVAISKFLHFWNPRLFVIVDRGVMWHWVFRQNWLWQQVVASAPSWLKPKRGDNCDLPCYLAILLWSAEVLRDNPAIIKHFAKYVRRESKGLACDLPLETYEAAAMEWLLLGLTELPPAGVS